MRRESFPAQFRAARTAAGHRIGMRMRSHKPCTLCPNDTERLVAPTSNAWVARLAIVLLVGSTPPARPAEHCAVTMARPVT